MDDHEFEETGMALGYRLIEIWEGIVLLMSGLPLPIALSGAATASVEDFDPGQIFEEAKRVLAILPDYPAPREVTRLLGTALVHWLTASSLLGHYLETHEEWTVGGTLLAIKYAEKCSDQAAVEIMRLMDDTQE